MWPPTPIVREFVPLSSLSNIKGPPSYVILDWLSCAFNFNSAPEALSSSNIAFVPVVSIAKSPNVPFPLTVKVAKVPNDVIFVWAAVANVPTNLLAIISPLELIFPDAVIWPCTFNCVSPEPPPLISVVCIKLLALIVPDAVIGPWATTWAEFSRIWDPVKLIL